MPDPRDRIRELILEIEEVKASLPAHSIPASMLQHLEDLEDELAQLRKDVKSENDRTL